MYVDVQSDLSVTLQDRDNFSSLSVMHAAGAESDVDQALRKAGAGHVTGSDHAALSPAWLRLQGPEGPWQEQCDVMLARAKSAGWIELDGSVLAHLAPRLEPPQ